MLNFAWWWVFFVLPLPIIVRLLSRKAQDMPMAALRVPNLRPGDVSEQTQLKQTKVPLVVSSLIWLLLVMAARAPSMVRRACQHTERRSRNDVSGGFVWQYEDR